MSDPGPASLPVGASTIAATPDPYEHWDASTYDRVSDPQARWGSRVVDRLDLAGDEAVLDAGCGTGRVTELLLERLPNGRVLALDRSPAMAAIARRRLPPDRAGVVLADLRHPLPIGDARLDAVLSTATFHWVPDHRGLLMRLARVLRPGGQLVFQCGGEGNIASVADALDEVWTFASPEDTEARLEQAGFMDFWVWLNDDTTEFPSRASLATFLRTVVLWPHLERLPLREHDAFVEMVLDRLPGNVLDYVRLNVIARKGP